MIVFSWVIKIKSYYSALKPSNNFWFYTKQNAACLYHGNQFQNLVMKKIILLPWIVSVTPSHLKYNPVDKLRKYGLRIHKLKWTRVWIFKKFGKKTHGGIYNKSPLFVGFSIIFPSKSKWSRVSKMVTDKIRDGRKIESWQNLIL